MLDRHQNNQDEMSAKGVTRTSGKKKAILSHSGNIIRVKIDVNEDMETVYPCALEKKGVRRAKTQFDIADSALTLQGQSDFRHELGRSLRSGKCYGGKKSVSTV